MIFAIYNLLTMGFAVGLLIAIRAHTDNRRRTTGALAASFLIAEGVFGFATVFFPEGAPGAPIAGTGVVHIVLAGLSSLTTMLTILLLAFWFGTAPGLKGYGRYSFASVAVVFISGGLAAASIATHGSFGGLAERITIGVFLLWMFVVALKLYRMSDSGTEASRQAHA